MSGKTRKLDFSKDIAAVATPELKTIDMGMPRPWRIALNLVEYQMQMIFDLTNPVTIGRASPESGYNPDIDLGAYAGSDRGVSRVQGAPELVRRRTDRGGPLRGRPRAQGPRRRRELAVRPDRRSA